MLHTRVNNTMTIAMAMIMKSDSPCGPAPCVIFCTTFGCWLLHTSQANKGEDNPKIKPTISTNFPLIMPNIYFSDLSDAQIFTASISLFLPSSGCPSPAPLLHQERQIGRASCRERVDHAGVS